MPKPSQVFLSAEWLDLIFLNYSVDPGLLLPFVPQGTTLDSFDGKTHLSLVGFRFCNTRLFGKFSIPFHRQFEEVNLRFYVRREIAGELRRGVVFIKEIVPKPLIAWTARVVYGENYVSLPMNHRRAPLGDRVEVEYSWKHAGQWSRIHARTSSAPQLPSEQSLGQFITEHYWGYARGKSGDTLEYHVTHTPWTVRLATDAAFTGNAASLYGSQFAAVLSKPPDSAYLAEGSSVQVLTGAKI